MLRVYAVAGGFDADAQAVMDEMDVVGTAPDGARQTVINDLVVALKAAGAWAKMDRLYVLAAHEAAAARIDWKNPGTDSLSETNSPAFVADTGYIGNGTNAQLRGATNLSTLSLYLQDDAHISAFVVADATGTDDVIMGTVAGLAGGGVGMWPRRSSGYVRNRLNAGASWDAPNATDDLGWFLICRTGANALEAYRNGVSLGTDATVSTARPASPLTVLGIGSGSSTHRVGLASIGGSLTDTEAADAYTAVNAYMVAVGAV